MEEHFLQAISPIDGRYGNKTQELIPYFSEYALFKYRVLVEIEYFIALGELKNSQLPTINDEQKTALRAVYQNFSTADAHKTKEIEKVTNHDVKAVEYFIKEKIEPIGLEKYTELVHFGLTSQDINNTAIPKSIADFLDHEYLPQLDQLVTQLFEMAKEWEEQPMLAKTHGQPASPTTLGKEIYVFVERLIAQIKLLKQIPISAKFGGATGNFNAHHIAFPEIDWVTFGNDFLTHQLGLSRSQTTTQIEHYDNFAALCHCMSRINTILIDFSRDIWQYISMEYFKQKIKEGEIGSSAMPHKVNPIDFENAEGNLGVANALLIHFAEKLPISRLQRDLTDSTVLRNVGTPMGHTIIAFKNIKKGLGKLILNAEAVSKDLDQNWAVVAEALQTILRKEQDPKHYEAQKEITNTNTTMNKNAIHTIIDSLDVNAQLKPKTKQINH